jgi:hypothetical protein
MRSRVHIAIRIDFPFVRNYLFSGIASCVLLSYEPPFSINKMHIQSNNFVFVFITALIAKTSVYFDKNLCILRHRGPFQCMFIGLKT